MTFINPTYIGETTFKNISDHFVRLLKINFKLPLISKLD